MKKRVTIVSLLAAFLIIIASIIILKMQEEIGIEKGRLTCPMVLKEGDKFFGQLKLDEAIYVYEKILEEDPADYEVLWRLARAYAKKALLIDKEHISEKYLHKAIDYAEDAIGINDNRFEGHLYLAESLGLLLKYEGPRDRVRFIRKVKEEAERTIELNPSHYRGHLFLGILHREIKEANWLERQIAKVFFGGIPEASFEEAERSLKRSVELRPDFPRTHYELALVYIALKNKELAIEELKKEISCPVTNKKEENLRRKSILLLNKLR